MFFRIGPSSNRFEPTFDVESLRSLVGLAREALARAGWLTSSREAVAVAQFSGRPRRRLYRFTEGGLRLARERLFTGNTKFFLILAAAANLSFDQLRQGR